ncbi:MAG: hypothetical protein IJ105_02215 [Bacilli bacterium]|nr:hypothetical protein [Bacilli bacterium]
MNNIVISENIVNNYKNNINVVLKDLKFRIKSGSFNEYDLALYDALVKEDQKNKKLQMRINVSA